MNNVKEFSSSFLGEKYYKIQHGSGLKILICPKKRQGSYALFATEFGSIDNTFIDENGKKIKLPDGIAHFMEHKMFDNGDGESVDDIFSRLGADPNAFTSWEKTAYVASGTSGEQFYDALGELIDFVLKPYFTDESVAKEQGIIGQEIAECEDDPYDRCFYGMIRGLYEKNPIRIDVVGSTESIAEITPEMLYECHRRFYSPSNMVFIVCGDVLVDRVLCVVDEHVKAEKINLPVIHICQKERIGAYKKTVVHKMAVERPIFSIGFKDSKAPEEPYARRRRQILCEILTGVIFSSSNELYNSLFKKGIMTSPFSYGEEYGRSFSLCYASGECDDPELLQNEIRKYLKRLKKNGISREDFERRKKIIYASDVKTYDFTWDVASALLDNAFTDVDIFEESNMLASLTIDDANALLRELFRENNMTCSIVIPSEE